LVGRSSGGGTGPADRAGARRKGADGPVDVLQPPLAEIVEIEVQLAGHVFVHPAGDGDAAGRRDLLQARRDVHTVAEDVVAVDHHVADMHAHAERHAQRLRLRRVPLGHVALHGDGAGHGRDDGWKLGEETVARELDDPPAVQADHRLQRRQMPLQRADGAVLVPPGQGAEAGHVGGENGGKAAGHGGSPSLGILCDMDRGREGRAVLAVLPRGCHSGMPAAAMPSITGS